MARQNATNFSGGLQFPYATAATDLFKKEDVQTLALAVDQHDHSAGKGLLLPNGAFADNTLNGSKLIDGTVTSAKIADGTIVAADLAADAVTQWVTYEAIATFSSTVTGSYVPTPVTLPALMTTGGRLQLWCSFALAHSAGPGALVRAAIMRDGSAVAALSIYHNAAVNQVIPCSFVFSDLPAAGAHTYTLALYNVTAGTMSLDGGTTASMIATEFKR